MSVVSIAEAKDTLPALVSAAQSGETVTITRHGKPVAQISAVSSSTCSPQSLDWIEGQLSALPRPATDPVALLRAMRDDE